jgi:hypothetical protein
MPRWIAIGTAPGWDDIETFNQEMNDTAQWRPGPRTTITTVYALDDGRLLAECHAVEQKDFEDWLQEKGWQTESITPVKYVAKTGSVWEIS